MLAAAEGAGAYDVAVAVINRNGVSTLVPTIEHVFAQDYPGLREVILLDDCSTDESVALVERTFGDKVRVVRNSTNVGVSAGRNIAMQEASAPLVMPLDNDILMAKDYVRLLVDVFKTRPDAGCVAGQTRYYDRPDVVQYNGVDFHFVAEAQANTAEPDGPVQVGALAGGTALFHKERMAHIGWSDEDFFFGWTDGDAMFRLCGAGFPCYSVSRARCLHVKVSRGKKYMRNQVRNRLWFICKNYDLRTLALAAPALLAFQVFVAMGYTARGSLSAYLGGWLAALRTLPATLRKRHAFMAVKRVHDGTIMRGERIDVLWQAGGGSVGKVMSRALNAAFSAYWALIRPLLKK